LYYYCHFYRYKTANNYGLVKIPVSDELASIIDKWKKLNTSNYLLINPKTLTQMKSRDLSRLLSERLGVTNTQIRHNAVINRFQGESTQKQKQELASLMGHSINLQQTIYRS